MTDLQIIFQHTDFVVAVKPAGLSFHSEEGAGFVALLSQQLNQPLYPVHRLDKVTSGLLLLAKHAQAAAQLSELFVQRQVDKYYIALIDNRPKKKQGWIIGDMAKSRRGCFKLLKSKENPAITRFESGSVLPGLRACLLKPVTGKTHQLRVALKSLGAPILGDLSYGGTKSDRVYLHAFTLQFVWQAQVYRFQHCPEPAGQFAACFEHALFERWQYPEQLEW